MIEAEFQNPDQFLFLAGLLCLDFHEGYLQMGFKSVGSVNFQYASLLDLRKYLLGGIVSGLIVPRSP